MTTERARQGTAAIGVKIPDNPINIHQAGVSQLVRARIAGAIIGLALPRLIISRRIKIAAKRTFEAATTIRN